MGKNYYCDYCDKRMKNDVQIRKKHDDGLPHKTAKLEYYQKFKTARQILSEELKKTRCHKFITNQQCNFGIFCRYSHYSPDELQRIQRIVNAENYKFGQLMASKIYPRQEMIDTFMLERNENRRNSQIESIWPTVALPNLPPSLATIDPHQIPDNPLEWGAYE